MAALDREDRWEQFVQLFESEISNSAQDVAGADQELGAPLRPDEKQGSASAMCARDIAQIIDTFAQSRGCDANNISYYYEPVMDEDGKVVLSELVLVFSLKSLVNDLVADCPIHRLRVVVPQEVQQRARAMLEAATGARPREEMPPSRGAHGRGRAK